MPDEPKTNDFEDFDDNEDLINPTRSALAAVAAGILVIIAGFLVWNYLQNLGGDQNNAQDIQEILDEVNNEKNSDKKDTNSEEQAVSNEEMTKESKIATDTTKKEEIKTEAKSAEVVTNKTPVSATYAVNDYNKGDIKEGKYVVKEGDTLWEIAEAVYESGFEWQTIADANPSLVYTLVNGNVGIDTGVTLTIPALK